MTATMNATATRKANDFFSSLPRWTMAEEIGYEPKTTFWMDYSIADRYGIAGIRDTFKRAMHDWKNDPVYLSEMALVLNHKSWQWAKKNVARSQEYVDLYYKAYDYAVSHFKGEDLRYFYSVID